MAPGPAPQTRAPRASLDTGQVYRNQLIYVQLNWAGDDEQRHAVTRDPLEGGDLYTYVCGQGKSVRHSRFDLADLRVLQSHSRHQALLIEDDRVDVVRDGRARHGLRQALERGSDPAWCGVSGITVVAKA